MTASLLFFVGQSGPLAGMPDAGPLFDGVIRSALHAAGHFAEGSGSAEDMDGYRTDSNAARFGEIAKRGQKVNLNLEVDEGRRIRVDSFSPTAGAAMARQLEYRCRQVLEEPMPELSADGFPSTSEVPPGVRTHTVSRQYANGEAVIYRKGEGVPQVGLSIQEEQFQIRHIASAYGWDHFDNLSMNFAGIGLQAAQLRNCRRAVAEKRNRLIWNGSDVDKLYGILNYPWLARKVVSTPFDGTADPDDVVAELNAGANYAEEHSSATMRPNAVKMSHKVYNYLSNTRMNALGNETILEYWLRTNSMNIKIAQKAWELADQAEFPGDAHGILFYANDDRSIKVVDVQPFNTLPVQMFGFNNINYAYATLGGVIMADVGNNLLMLVTVSA